MIEIKDLTFWYSKRNRLFEDLNLNLDSGHIYGLLGKNGAGKTTLLKLICGLSFPKTGSVSVNGYIPSNRQPGFLADIFFLPEEISLPPFTPLKFADIYKHFYPAFNYSQYRVCLGNFQVDTTQGMNKLSHGQQRKAMLAFALATNTSCLFLDEPTNGLDIPSKASFRRMLAASLSEGKTIILSTHMVRDLQSMIDSVLILENHKLSYTPTVDQNLEDFFTASVSIPEIISTSLEN